ncbi:hypothetical protein F5887DRAFT_272669 [Amanita rubescens]|nr:hypothetical protein F5887DRAFT_272669 [Amanita rubescens]
MVTTAQFFVHGLAGLRPRTLRHASHRDRILAMPEEPTFLGPAFAALRQILIAAKGISDEDAASLLLESWRADRQDEGRDDKVPKEVTWDDNKQIGDSIIQRPCQYACDRLKNWQYVPLWYFCPEGCAEATEVYSKPTDDASESTRTNSGFVAFKQDHELTWCQFGLARFHFLENTRSYKWPQRYIDSLSNFFRNIFTHNLRFRNDGERVLLLYASRVRREWHDSLERGEGFNIGIINERLLDAISREVYSLEHNLQNTPTPFPSITWLPDDIIQEILIWYVNDDPCMVLPFLPMKDEKYSSSSYWDSDDSDDDDDDDDDDYSDSPDEISPFEEKPFVNLPLPFVISRVCSSWRRVALSTPRLWNNVWIETFNPSSKRLAAEWLLKAGSSPVSITIYDLESDLDFDIYDELRDFLSAYRIKSLELPLLSETCPALPLLLAELPEERIAHLKSLSLVDLEDEHHESLLLDNARYPYLRELQLTGRFVVDMIVLPWTSLRRLDAANALLPMMRCLQILRESVSLEVCYLGISSDTRLGLTMGDLYLPTLRELTLSFEFEADVGGFLQRLTTPNLKILTIERAELDSARTLHWSNLEYSRMMERSNRPLYHLTVRQSTRSRRSQRPRKQSNVSGGHPPSSHFSTGNSG